MRIDLIRHLPVRIAPGLCYGSSDLPARECVPRDLEALRATLPADVRLVSSPLKRCASLASLLAPQAACLVLDPRLQEIHFGQWELREWDAIDRAQIDTWALAPWTYTPPGGESAEQMSQRVMHALDEWIQRDIPHLVVIAHGGPLRVMLGELLKLPRDSWLGLPCDTGSITRLDLGSRSTPAVVIARQLLEAA